MPARGRTSTGRLPLPVRFTQGPDPNKASATAGDGLASMLLGVGSGPLTLNRSTATQSPYYAGYVADDWKVTRG